jgi:hypothetical protein
MHRICPGEEKLAEYLTRAMEKDERDAIELHLSRCDRCRETVGDVSDLIHSPCARRTFSSIRTEIIKNLYPILAFFFLALSFLLERYFLQFLAASLICGARWIWRSGAPLLKITSTPRAESPSEEHSSRRGL